MRVAWLVASALAATARAQQGAIDWAPVRAAVDAFSGYRTSSFGVLVGNASGILFSYTRGALNFSAPLAVASASKWVSAMAIALEGERNPGVLAAETRPQQLIASFPSAPGDARSNITLGQLLGFISGLGDVPCTDGIDGDPASLPFWQCVANLTVANNPLRYGPPGRNFSYGGGHLQLAAAMAAVSLAGGTTANASWPPVWQQLRVAAGLPPLSGVYTPLVNPLVAGGLVISPTHYATILTRYMAGGLLPAATVARLEADQIPSARVAVAKSPMLDYGFDWHYASGHWVECRANSTCLSTEPGCSSSPPLTRWAPHCDAGCERSSPGAFGFYPYVNRCFSRGTNGFWGVVTLPNGTALASSLLGNTLWPAVRAAFASQFGSGATGSPSGSTSSSPTATGSASLSPSGAPVTPPAASTSASPSLSASLAPSATASPSPSSTPSPPVESPLPTASRSLEHTPSGSAGPSAVNGTGPAGDGGAGAASGGAVAGAVISALVLVGTACAAVVAASHYRRAQRAGVLSSAGYGGGHQPSGKMRLEPRASMTSLLKGGGGGGGDGGGSGGGSGVGAAPVLSSSRRPGGGGGAQHFTNPARGGSGRQ